MTPSTKLMIAADRLANRPCSDTERATANLLALISSRLHERGFDPESELLLALALADAIESEHAGPEASATQPLPDRAEADQYLPEDLKPAVPGVDLVPPVEHAEKVVAFERGMGWRGTCQCGFKTAGYVKEFDARRTIEAHIALSRPLVEVVPQQSAEAV